MSLAAYGGAGVLNQVWQVGPAVTGGVPAPHAMGGANLAAKAKLDLLTQTTTAASSSDAITKKRNVSTNSHPDVEFHLNSY